MGRKPKTPVIVEGPELPCQLEYLWVWFHDISMGRGSTGFGPARLAWRDLQAWCEVTQQPLQAWEVEALMRLDIAYVAAEATRAEKQTQQGKQTNKRP